MRSEASSCTQSQLHLTVLSRDVPKSTASNQPINQSDRRVDQLLILLTTEHLLVIIKIVIAAAIPDVPEWIQLRNNYNRIAGLQQQQASNKQSGPLLPQLLRIS